jgi:hypothetical protein
MLDPTTLITKYFPRKKTMNSAANKKHGTAHSRQLIPAVTHLILRHAVNVNNAHSMRQGTQMPD